MASFVSFASLSSVSLSSVSSCAPRLRFTTFALWSAA